MCCCSRASTTCGHPWRENQVEHFLLNGKEICWAVPCHPGSVVRPKAEKVNGKRQVLIIDFKVNQDIIKKVKPGDSNRQSMLVISSRMMTTGRPKTSSGSWRYCIPQSSVSAEKSATAGQILPILMKLKDYFKVTEEDSASPIAMEYVVYCLISDINIYIYIICNIIFSF